MPRDYRRGERRGRGRAARLVLLSQDEQDEFLERQVAEYADEKQRAGHWVAEEALRRSRESIHGLIGDDPTKGGHRFFKGVDTKGKRVGWIWVGPPPPMLQLERAQWLYQITVEESVRGKGFGRAMLRTLEGLLAREGFEVLHLNVFKWNSVARSLYDSMGYEVVLETETEAGMRKRL